MMTPDQLAAAGKRLYGQRWQTALASWLGVGPRSVRRWAGAEPDSDAVPEPLARRIRERLAQLDAEPGPLDRPLDRQVKAGAVTLPRWIIGRR